MEKKPGLGCNIDFSECGFYHYLVQKTRIQVGVVPILFLLLHFFLSSAGGNVVGAGLRVLSQTEKGLELELVLDTVYVESTGQGQVVIVPGLDRPNQPGEFDLPAKIVLVGVPQQGEVRLTTEALELQAMEVTGLRLAPGFRPTATQEETRSSVRGFRPWAELEKIDIVRGVRVAFLRLNPVQYDSARHMVRVARRLRVRIFFAAPGRYVTSIDRFDPMLEAMLVNGKQTRYWKLSDPEVGSSSFFERASVWCKVKTESTGVYRLTAADLRQAGFVPEEIDPRTFRLYALGPYRAGGPYPDTMVEVAIYVKGEEDGRFDKQDYIAFYAQATSCWSENDSVWLENLYTDYRCFWLTWGGEAGKRMQTVSGAGAGSPAALGLAHVRLEQDLLCPARSGLLWLWQKFFKQAGVPRMANPVRLSLPGRRSIISLAGRLYGARNEGDTVSRHPCRLFLNGVRVESLALIPSHSVPPPADFFIDSLPPQTIRPVGVADTLVFEFLGDPEMVDYLDYLEVRYLQELRLSATRPALGFSLYDSGTVEFALEGATGEVILLDVTDWYAPKRIVDTEVSAGRRKVKTEVRGRGDFFCALAAQLKPVGSLQRSYPGGLRSATEQVDYYIVCPDEFYPAARLLARYRENNVAGLPGARVRAVRLSEIYDDYAFGMEEPGAIQSFFAHKRPVYGLLAGDATYDYRNRLGMQRPPGVPTYEMGYDIDPEVYGQTARASDAWFADFEGRGGAPDMILARITCRSAAELRQFLEKVRVYETQSLGLWAKKFLLLADDEWLGEPDPVHKRDPIGFQHISGCEDIMLYTRGLLDPVKIYLTEYPFTGVNDKAGARSELLARLNQGALFWCFYGHGAGFQLCHERALRIDGVPQVMNGSRNPLAFFGSCGVGRFDDTRYEAIAEELVRKESGCIATFGGIKATTPGANELFARTLFGSLVQNDTLPIGPAFFRAWLTYVIYHMFGDPATRVRLPRPGYEPVVMPDTFYPGTRVTVVDSVPVEKGMYGILARELTWSRYYFSEAGWYRYTLPGYQLYEASGTFGTGRTQLSFTVPVVDYPDTLVVPNGTYIRLPNTASVSLLAWDGETGYAARKADIALGPAVAVFDSTPPTVALYADDRPLVIGDTVRVPRKFTLTGVVSDSSGILLAAVPDGGLGLFIGARTSGRIELAYRFSYDRNSSTTGRFEYPVELRKELDSLTLVVSDNMRNRRVATAYVRTERSDALRVENALVYPNPVAGPAKFTFELTRSAFVTVKVFSLSGRLVRKLPEQVCTYGYNQIEWDGLDSDGEVPANGVYLYKLEVVASEPGATQSRTSFRDRFIIQR